MRIITKYKKWNCNTKQFHFLYYNSFYYINIKATKADKIK